MRTRIVSVVLVATVAAFALAGAMATRTAAQNPMGDADAEPAPFNPQMAAMMSMLIQPRHAKLGLAGKEENWALAGYAFKELKQSFLITARAVPRWKGLPVPHPFHPPGVPRRGRGLAPPAVCAAALGQPLALLDFAIKANEPRQFAEAYGRVTTGCNACHATTDHAFIVIKAPDGGAGAFPNQDFTPKR